MGRAVELLDNDCSANGLAYEKEISTGGYQLCVITATHKCTSRDPEVTGAPGICDGESAERESELVIELLANAPRARAKLEGEQFIA